MRTPLAAVRAETDELVGVGAPANWGEAWRSSEWDPGTHLFTGDVTNPMTGARRHPADRHPHVLAPGSASPGPVFACIAARKHHQVCTAD